MSDLWQRVMQTAQKRIYLSHGKKLTYRFSDGTSKTVMAIKHDQNYNDINQRRPLATGSLSVCVLDEPPIDVLHVTYDKKKFGLGCAEPTVNGEWQLALTSSVLPTETKIKHKKRQF